MMITANKLFDREKKTTPTIMGSSSVVVSTRKIKPSSIRSLSENQGEDSTNVQKLKSIFTVLKEKSLIDIESFKKSRRKRREEKRNMREQMMEKSPIKNTSASTVKDVVNKNNIFDSISNFLLILGGGALLNTFFELENDFKIFERVIPPITKGVELFTDGLDILIPGIQSFFDLYDGFFNVLGDGIEALGFSEGFADKLIGDIKKVTTLALQIGVAVFGSARILGVSVSVPTFTRIIQNLNKSLGIRGVNSLKLLDAVGLKSKRLEFQLKERIERRMISETMFGTAGLQGKKLPSANIPFDETFSTRSKLLQGLLESLPPGSFLSGPDDPISEKQIREALDEAKKAKLRKAELRMRRKLLREAEEQLGLKIGQFNKLEIKGRSDKQLDFNKLLDAMLDAKDKESAKELGVKRFQDLNPDMRAKLFGTAGIQGDSDMGAGAGGASGNRIPTPTKTPRGATKGFLAPFKAYSKNFFKTFKIPIIGGLIDFALNYFLFGEPPGRAAFKAIGSTLLGTILGLAGSGVGGPIGATILGLGGGIAGDILGGLLYDIIFSNSTTDSTNVLQSYASYETDNTIINQTYLQPINLFS